jgi:hypothetical protein
MPSRQLTNRPGYRVLLAASSQPRMSTARIKSFLKNSRLDSKPGSGVGEATESSSHACFRFFPAIRQLATVASRMPPAGHQPIPIPIPVRVQPAGPGKTCGQTVPGTRIATSVLWPSRDCEERLNRPEWPRSGRHRGGRQRRDRERHRPMPEPVRPAHKTRDQSLPLNFSVNSAGRNREADRSPGRLAEPGQADKGSDLAGNG